MVDTRKSDPVDSDKLVKIHKNSLHEKNKLCIKIKMK